MTKNITMEFALWVTILLALTGNGIAQPVEQCAGFCRDTGKSFYQVGSKYEYDYHAETVSKIGGIEGQEARLNFSATVDIHILTACEYVLQVRDVRLNDSYRSDFSSVIEKNSLRFWNHNGIIKRLCPSDGESEWALNIKRGILSTLQNSMEDLQEPTFIYETDILGTCKTFYDIEVSDIDVERRQELVVRKTKDLQKCSNHISSRSENAGPLKKSVNLLRGSYSCDQYFSESGTLIKVVCEETQLLQPFSNQGNGAKAIISTSLSLNGIVNSVLVPSSEVGSVFTTLKYQADTSTPDLIEDDSGEDFGAINTALQNLYESSINGLSSSYPHHFNQLVAELQNLDSGSFQKIISSNLNSQNRKHIIEAISLVRTDESLVAIKDLYSSGVISAEELNSVLSTISFIRSPTLRTISILSDLIENEVTYPLDDAKIMLSLSSVVRSYCQKNPQCQKEDAVKRIMTSIEIILGDDCSANSRKTQNNIIIALKAIGNAGFISDVETLNLCFTNRNNPMKIRLAAIDALRKMNCDSVRASHVFDIYTTLEENTEMRIAAYLMSMRCPFDRIFSLIRNTLHDEKINQVGSFVWTHLENLHGKSTPHQHFARSIISDNQLKNKFNTDARRFSRNYEGSTYFDSINTGAAVESNVVFSPESYLPRSLSLNLSLDIFGESVNMFDFGTRLEGFESIVESVFDKNGYFPDENIRSMLENMKTQTSSAEENEIDRLSDVFQSSRSLPKTPQGSFYARIFDNELYLKQFDGLKELIDLDNHNLNVNDIFRKMLQSKVEFSKTVRFLDTWYEISTIAGLPLKLKIDGTAALKFKSSAESDFKNFFTANSFSLDAFFNPSAVVTVNGEMIIDAYVTKSGLISTSQLHSNTYLDVNLKVENQKLVDVKINVPRQESEILSVSSQIFSVSDGIKTELEGITEDKEEWHYVSSRGFSDTVGFKIYSELSYANASRFGNAPYFPLTGPFKLAANLIKTDNFSAYHFKYEHEETITALGSNNKGTLMFETPGSKVEHHLKLEYEVSVAEADRYFNAALLFSDKNLSVKYHRRDNNQISFDVIAATADKAWLNTSGSISAKPHQNSGKRFDLIWKMNYLEIVNYIVSGQFDSAEGKFAGKMNIEGLSKNPIQFSGSYYYPHFMKVNPTVTARVMNLEMVSDAVTFHLNAHSKESLARLMLELSLDYALSGKRQESINVSYKWTNKIKSVSSKDTVQLALETSEFAAYNTNITWSLIRSKNYFDMNSVLACGHSVWHSRQLYRNWQSAGGLIDFSVDASISNPSKSINYNFAIDYQVKAKMFRFRILGQLNEAKKMMGLISYEKKSAVNRRLDITAESPWNLAVLSASLSSKTLGVIDLLINGEYSSNGIKEHTFKVQGILTTPHQDQGSKFVEYQFDGSVELPEALTCCEPILISFHSKTELFAQHFGERYLQVHFKDYNASLKLSNTRQDNAEISARFQTPEKLYNGTISVLNSNDKSVLTVDLNLSKHVYFVFHRSFMPDIEDIKSQLFWDYDGNQNKTVGLHLSYSESEKIIDVNLEDLFIGLKLLLSEEFPESGSMHHYLLSSSWGKNKEEISGKLEFSGTASNLKSLSFDEKIGKNVVRHEYTLNTTIITPFKEFEYQNASFNHKREIAEESFVAGGPRFWTLTSSKVSFTWPQKGYLDFGKEVFAEVVTVAANDKLAAQFTYFNEFSLSSVYAVDLSINYTLVDNGFESVLYSSYNRDFPLIHINTKQNHSESRVDLHFTSPCAILTSFSTNVVASRSFDYVIFETKWAPEKNITFWYSINLPNYIGAEFMSPLPNFRVLTVQYKTKGISDLSAENLRKEVEISAQLNNDKAFISLSGLQADSSLEGALIVSCPPFVDNLFVVLDQEYHENKLTEKLTVKKGLENQTVVDANVMFDFQDYSHTSMLIDLKTASNLVFIEATNKFDKEGVNCSLSGKWNEEYVQMKLNGEYREVSDEASVQCQLSISGSPFKNNYDIILQHFHDGQNYESLLILPFSDTDLKHSLNLRDWANWHNSIVLESKYLSLSILNEQRLFSDEFKGSMMVVFNGKKNTCTVNLNFDENFGLVKTGSLELITSEFDPIFIEYDSTKSLKTVVLDAGEKSLLFTKQSLTIKYAKNKEVSLMVDGHAATSYYFMYDIAIKSPYYNNSNITVKCDWTQALKVAWASIEHNGHSYELHFDHFRTDLIMNSSLTLSQNHNQISVSQFNYDLMNDVKRIELITITKNKKYNLLIESHVKPDKCRLQFVLNSPFNSWKKLLISLDCDVSKAMKMAAFNCETNTGSLSISSSFMQTWNAVKLSVALNSNFGNKQLMYSLVGEGESLMGDESTVSLTFLNNDEASKISGRWQNGRLLKTASLELSSPYEGFRAINGSIRIAYNSDSLQLPYTISIQGFAKDFRLKSGVVILIGDDMKTYTSWLTLSSAGFKDFSSVLELVKSDSSMSFNASFNQDDKFAVIHGIQKESDSSTEFSVDLHSNQVRYERLKFEFVVDAQPDTTNVNTLHHNVRSKLEIIDFWLTLNTTFVSKNQFAHTGSLHLLSSNLDIPEVLGRYTFNPTSESGKLLSLKIKQTDKNSHFIFSAKDESLSLSSSLNLPLVRLSPTHFSLYCFNESGAESCSFGFLSTSDSSSETFINGSLSKTDSEFSVDAKSSFPRFKTIFLSTKSSGSKNKHYSVVFSRNNSSMNAVLQVHKNPDYDITFRGTVNDEYLKNWDFNFSLNNAPQKKYLSLVGKKGNDTKINLLVDFKFEPSKFSLISNGHLCNHSLDSKFIVSNSTLDIIVYLNREPMIDGRGEINFKQNENSELMDKEFRLSLNNSTLFRSSYQNATFELFLAPKLNGTYFTCRSTCQKFNHSASGFFSLSPLNSLFSVETSKLSKANFQYNFKDWNKTVSLHIQKDSKFLQLGGNLIISQQLSELKLSRSSHSARNCLFVKYDRTSEIDLEFSLTNNTADIFKFLVFVNRPSEFKAFLNIPALLEKNLPYQTELNYNLTEHKNSFFASVSHKGSVHLIDAVMVSENMTGIIYFNASSQFLPLTKKVIIDSNFNLAQFPFGAVNVSLVTDSSSANSSVKINSLNAVFTSFLTSASDKSKFSTKGIDLDINFNADNKTVSLNILKPGQSSSDNYFAQLYFKNFTADSKIVRKTGNSLDVVSLSYDFLFKREFLFRVIKSSSLLHELGFNLNDLKSSSLYFSNIWKITNFKLIYDFSKISSMNFEINYLSRKLDCQILSSWLYENSTIDSSLAFLWNHTETAAWSAVGNQSIDFKISNLIRILPEDRLIKNTVSLNGLDYFGLLISQKLVSIPDGFKYDNDLDFDSIIFGKSQDQLLIKGEAALFERIWGTDIKMEADVSLNEQSKEENVVTNVGRYSLTYGGEPKVSAIVILDHNVTSNLYSFGSSVRYQSEYDHEFNIKINSSLIDASQEIYSSFSWNDEILFLNFTFDLSIDKSVINASVKSSHFQDVNVFLNYDLKSNDKYARLTTKFGTNTYSAKAQVLSSPKNKTLHLKLKSPVEGLSSLQLMTEISSFGDDEFLTKKKILVLFARESSVIKLDASFDLDSNPENPKLSIIMSGINVPEWNGKSKNWLLTLHGESIPEINISMKISKWKVDEEQDSKKSMFIQVKGLPASMQLSIDFPDVSKSIKASYDISLNKTHKSASFNFHQGKDRIFLLNGVLSLDKIGVTSFEVDGFCHPTGNFKYTGVYKNRGKQSIVLTLKHNEHVNEIEGYLRYTIRSSYFDLEFDSSLNGEKRMHIKGMYDFNSDRVKSALFNVYFEKFELKAKFSGKAMGSITSADMLIDSTVKTIRNINLKFELTSPNKKENNILLLAHINDVDYRLNCDLKIDDNAVSSKLDFVFPMFILKDLKYEIVFQEKSFDMIVELSEEKLFEFAWGYELNATLAFASVSLDVNPKISPFINGSFSCLTRVTFSDGSFSLSLMKSPLVESNSSRYGIKTESLFIIQGHVTNASSEMVILLHYGNEENKIVLKYGKGNELNQIQEGLLKQTGWNNFSFELFLPSLSQNLTKCDFLLSRVSTSEEFSWKLDVELISPIKSVSNLKNHFYLNISPNFKRLNVLSNLVNNVAAKDGSIFELNLVSDFVNNFVNIEIREDIKNSALPALHMNSSCHYNFWKNIKIDSLIVIQNLSYQLVGDYQLDDEFHSKFLIITPIQTSNLKFGGFWKRSDFELNSKLYVNTFEVNYNSSLGENCFTGKKSFYLSSPKHNFKCNVTFSAALKPALSMKSDYFVKTFAKKYHGAFALENKSLDSVFTSEETSQEWLKCIEENISSQSTCNSLRVTKLKTGKINLTMDKISSKFVADVNFTASEIFKLDAQKIKYSYRLLTNIANGPDRFSFLSIVNFKKIQNKVIDFAILKNENKMRMNVFDVVLFDVYKLEKSGSLKFQWFDASGNSDWSFDSKSNFKLNFNFESSPSFDEKRIKSSCLIQISRDICQIRYLFSNENSYMKIEISKQQTFPTTYLATVESASRSFKTEIVFEDGNIEGELQFSENSVYHFVNFKHKTTFPLDSEFVLGGYLLGKIPWKINLKTKDLSLAFNVIPFASTSFSEGPHLLINAGLLSDEGTGFLHFKNSFFPQLKSVIIDGEFLKHGNRLDQASLSLSLLSFESEIKAVGSYGRESDVAAHYSLDVFTPKTDIHLRSALDLALKKAHFELRMNDLFSFYNRLDFNQLVPNHPMDYSFVVNLQSIRYKFNSSLEFTKRHDRIRSFLFSLALPNSKENVLMLNFENIEIIGINQQNFSLQWRDKVKTLVDAKVHVSFSRNFFQIYNEVILDSASEINSRDGTYISNVMFKNQDEKKISVWFSCPQFDDKKIGIDFHSHFESLRNYRLMFFVNAPFFVDMPFFRAVPQISLDVSNLIDPEAKSVAMNYFVEYNKSVYQASITSSSNDLGSLKNVTAVLNDDYVSFTSNTSASGTSLSLNSSKKSLESLAINLSIKHKSLLILWNAIEVLRMSCNVNIPNFEPASWYNQPFYIQVIVQNPVQPIHFQSSQKFEKDSYEGSLILRYHSDSVTGELSGIGFNYSKTLTSRNFDVEYFEKKFLFRKRHTPVVIDYSSKVIFKNQNEFGFRFLKGVPDETLLTTCLFSLFLPQKVISIRAFRSPLIENEVYTESSLGAALNIDDKQIELQLSTLVKEDSLSNELVFSHFAFDHDVIVRIYNDPVIKRLQVVYSEKIEDMFTVELQTIDVIDEETSESAINLIMLHHASKLMFTTKLHSIDSPFKNDMGLLITYRSQSSDSVKLIQVLKEYNKSSADLDFTLTSNRNSVKLGLNSFKDGYGLKVQMNHKEPLAFEKRESNERETLMKISYGESRACSLYYGMPSNKQLVLKSTTFLFGVEETDALLTVQLNSSRLLWGKLSIPSETFDVVQSILEEYNDLPVVAEKIYLGFFELGQENFLLPFAKISSQTAKAFELVLIQSLREVSKINANLDKINLIGLQMMEENHFYCKDIYEWLKSCLNYLEEEFAAIWKFVAETFNTIISPISKIILTSSRSIVKSITELSSFVEDIKNNTMLIQQVAVTVLNDIARANFEFRSSLESLIVSLRYRIVMIERSVIEQIQRFEEMLDNLLMKLENYAMTRLIILQAYYDYFDETVLQLEERINESLETLKSDLQKIEELQLLKYLIENNSSWLAHYRLSNLIKEVKYFIDLIMEMVVEDVRSNFGGYANTVQMSVLTSADYVEKQVDYPVFKNSFSFVNRVYQKLVWIRKYHSISLKMQENVRKLAEIANNYAKELQETLNPSSNINRSEDEELSIVVNISGNTIEFSQELPFDWDGFNEKPHFEQLEQQHNDTSVSELDDFNMYRHRLLSGLYHSLFNIASKEAPVSSLLPPFHAQGLLIGSQYFITFDGKMYNFSSEDCSYILAGDFDKKTVFVTVNYITQDGIPTKKSVSVISQGHEIEINHLDRRVYIDSKVTELPVEVSNKISVMHDEMHRIIVSTSFGLTVDCNMYSDICSIHATGWMFGKTGGLLGTYDNEPANDFSLPNNTVVNQVNKFAESWALQKNRECKASQLTLTSISKIEREPISGKTLKDCEFYFRSKISPFRSCFPKVKPEPFLELCKYGLNKPSASGLDSSFCSAAAAYITSCNMKSVMKLPAKCVNHPFENSADIKSADVVFVVEESYFLQLLDVTKLTSKLSEALLAKNFTDINFGLVVFGGDKFNEPHIKTIEGEIWSNHVENVVQAFPSGRLFHSILRRNSKNTHTIQEALEFSLKLPWHAHVSKTVILMTGSELLENYEDALPSFVKNNVQLHVLSNRTFRQSKQRQYQILGANTTETFTENSVGSSPSDHPEQLSPSLQPLFAMNGTVFDPVIFSRFKNATYQRVINIWSEEVAASAAKAPSRYLCVGSTLVNEAGKPECFSISNKNQEWSQWNIHEKALDSIMSDDSTSSDELFKEEISTKANSSNESSSKGMSDNSLEEVSGRALVVNLESSR